MICPKCNAEVSMKMRRCSHCGQDLTNYRRFVNLSNQYYNDGLSKAKVRDLSGAIVSLRKSLKFNKLNTDARNLLGLIYYEEGEIVAALSEWVISKHFQEEGNEADGYIKEIQSNPNKLEMCNQTIKKYNAALNSAKHGDEDMAIIQLKKVTNLNPHFLRANQLLALLYMMSGEKANRIHAYRILKRISKVDVTNTTTLSYLKELSDLQSVSVEDDTEKKETKETNANTEHREVTKRRKLPREDSNAFRTVTPYNEEKPSIMPFIYILIGVIAGIAIMFLITSHLQSKKSATENKNFKKYSEDLVTGETNKNSLQAKNKDLEDQVKKLEAQINKLKGDDPQTIASVQQQYNDLIDAIGFYNANDKANASKKLEKVDESKLTGDQAKQWYEKIKNGTFKDASVQYFTSGRDAYNGQGEYARNQNVDEAIKLLKKSLKYDNTNTDSMYFLGRCYQRKNDSKKAQKYYNQIISQYPTSPRVVEAKARLREMGVTPQPVATDAGQDTTTQDTTTQNTTNQ